MGFKLAFVFILAVMAIQTITMEAGYLEESGNSNGSKRSAEDFKQYISQKDFDFKDDLIESINQIILSQKLSAEIERLMAPKPRRKCIWRSMFCREIRATPRFFVIWTRRRFMTEHSSWHSHSHSFLLLCFNIYGVNEL